MEVIKLERTLLLQNTGFPEKFNNVEIVPIGGLTKEAYVKQCVLNAINSCNPKLNITEVKYINLTDQFPQVNKSFHTGLIVEDIEINQVDKARYNNNGNYVWDKHGKCFARKIVSYVFFSQPTEKSRDILPQSIFPPIIDYMSDFIASPSYTIANHPIYYINIMNKRITAESLIRELAGFVALGFYYIEVFTNSLNVKDVPTGVEEFIKKYGGCDESWTSFRSNHYEIDFNLKKLKFKTNKFILGDYLVRNVSGNLDFQGSSEKFFWMDVLTIFSLALRDGYDVDYSEIELFYTSHVGRFGRSKKMKRFENLINYMKKLTFS